MIDIKIEAAGEDDNVATIRVMASAGEFNGTVIETAYGNDDDFHTTLVELTQDQAHQMIAALQAGIDYHAGLNA